MAAEESSHEKLVREAISEAAYGSGHPQLIDLAFEIYNKSQALIESGQRGEKTKFRNAIETVVEGIE